MALPFLPSCFCSRDILASFENCFLCFFFSSLSPVHTGVQLSRKTQAAAVGKNNTVKKKKKRREDKGKNGLLERGLVISSDDDSMNTYKYIYIDIRY